MSLRHTSGTAQALYRTFVLPNLAPSSIRPTKHNFINGTQRPGKLDRTRIRFFFSSSSTARNHKPASPEPRREKWDEEITAKYFYLVDPETEQISERPCTRYDVLNNMDRTTHRLVQVNAEYEDLPVCKIINKQREYLRKKRAGEAAKERKKLEGMSKSLKTLELNWAMDPNDLSHRMDKVVEFLSEGRKVEIILASKKKGKKASEEECQEVVDKILAAVDTVPGAIQAKPMEGKLGGYTTLFFQRKAGQRQASQVS